MGLVKEFKEFALRGNVIDMAVGIVIGAAFTGIVNSFVKDVMTPPLTLLTSHAGDFTELVIPLAKDANGNPVGIAIGLFINALISFVIVALALFLVIKAMNKLNKKEAAAPPPPAPPSKEQILLTEIRDLLARGR